MHSLSSVHIFCKPQIDAGINIKSESSYCFVCLFFFLFLFFLRNPKCDFKRQKGLRSQNMSLLYMTSIYYSHSLKNEAMKFFCLVNYTVDACRDCTTVQV